MYTGTLIALLILAKAETATTTTTTNNNKKSVYYGYLHTRSVDGEKKRTHVYQLTKLGTLAERFTTKIDEWREPDNEGNGQPESDEDSEPPEPNRYQGDLAFACPAVRNQLVERFYNVLVDFNKLATTYFAREGKTVPPDHLFEIREKFGPLYTENNQYLPTQAELNRLYAQFVLFRGASNEEKYSKVWGSWENHFRREAVRYMGYSEEEARSFNFWGSHSELPMGALTLRMMYDLETINKMIHALEAVHPWAVLTRFSFSTLKLGGMFRYAPLVDEDFEPDRWRLSLENGGLYMQYTHLGKNLLHIMHDNDFSSMEHSDDMVNKIEFQRWFTSHLYAAWAPIQLTEKEKRDAFISWWKQHDIEGKYGYEWGKKDEPNGYIKLGSQICDPPSDCDRPWIELLDEFAETPVVEDLIFTAKQPYGATEKELRFLYPGDDAVLRERARAWWFISWLFTPMGTPGFMFASIKTEIITWWVSSWLFNSVKDIDVSSWWPLNRLGGMLGMKTEL